MWNKEITNLESVVKNDSVSNKEYTLFESSWERSWVPIKGRLFEGHIGLKGGSMVYFRAT